MVNQKILFYVIGDYDTGSYNMKGIEPIIFEKIRRIFKNIVINNI